MHDDYFSIARETVHPVPGRPANAVIHLGGEFDLGARDELRDALVAAAESGDVALITVNLKDVTFIDSEAIAAIVDGYLTADQAGVAFRLARGDGMITRIFEVLGLAHLFETDDTQHAAETS